MRPDEHKKKKNTAYKKKHGIGKSVGDDNEKKKEHKNDSRHHEHQSQKSAKSKGRADSKTTLSDRGASAQVTKESSSSYSDSSDSESVTQSSRKPTKTFRRREIVSNWKKYELEPDTEENVSTRGEDYAKLLSMAGDAMSHFRFKDELEWEDSSGPGGGDSTDSYGQFLSVDPTYLTQSLECVPLHQVLGIHSDVFPADQLSAMIDTAKEKKSIYNEASTDRINSHIPLAQDDTDTLPSSDLKLSLQKSDTQPNALTSALKTKSTNKATSPKPHKIVSKEDSLAKVKTPHGGETAGINSGASNNITTLETTKSFNSGDSVQKESSKLILQDDELDALLGSDSSTAVDKKESKPSTSRPEKAPGTGSKNMKSPMPNTISNVNSKDCISPSPSQSKTASSEGNKTSEKQSFGKAADNTKKTAKDSADLEDWLDSILDD